MQALRKATRMHAAGSTDLHPCKDLPQHRKRTSAAQRGASHASSPAALARGVAAPQRLRQAFQAWKGGGKCSPAGDATV